MERVIDRKRELDRINIEMSMIRSVQRGDRIRCPYCDRGFLVARGSRILCSNEKCDAQYTLSY